MRYLIVGDLHGQMPLIHYKGFDAIIAPGDFCSDATRKFMFEALGHNLKHPDKPKQWWAIVGRRKAREMVNVSIVDGRKILDKLNSYGKPVFITPGNWEWKGKPDCDWSKLREDKYPGLIKGLDNIVDLHHRFVETDEVVFIGHGYISGPEYPQRKEEIKNLSKKELRDLKKDYLSQKKKLESLFKRASKKAKPVIFVSHNMPWDTKFDKIDYPASPPRIPKTWSTCRFYNCS